MKSLQIGLLAVLAVSLSLCSCRSNNPREQLKEQIAGDTLFAIVDSMAHEVVKGGFNAGDGYGEVWIRDYNTFI